MRRILLIDDEEKIRSVLQTLLTRAGYEVVPAEDGQKGLRRFREQPMDLVITDIVMPDKEGLSTIRELHRDFPKLPIIALSGGGVAAGAEAYLNIAQKLGARRVFEKPVEFPVLLQAVQELLSQAGQPAPT
jgi:CheY-like chemotaxis protein